jgi:hypothetical protein
MRLPTFDGPVEPGKNYIIVDDVVTSGSSLAGLRNHIEENGGRVVATSALGVSSSGSTGYGGDLAITAETVSVLENKFELGEMEAMLWDYGIAESIRALTNSQGRYLASFSSVKSIRNRIAEAGFIGRSQTDAGVVGRPGKSAQGGLTFSLEGAHPQFRFTPITGGLQTAIKPAPASPAESARLR